MNIMNKLFFLITAVILLSFVNVNAQDLLRVDEIEIVDSQPNNVTVQIKTVEAAQTILNRVNQTNVNAKDGFTTQFNADNTLLTLNFARQFNKEELKVLLTYSGIELKEDKFNQVFNLINQ